jgi:hypothetical protein
LLFWKNSYAKDTLANKATTAIRSNRHIIYDPCCFENNFNQNAIGWNMRSCPLNNCWAHNPEVKQLVIISCYYYHYY